MKEVKDLTVLIADTGLFLPMAQRMAEEAKRVIVWSSDQRSFPSLRQGIIGDGFDRIERVWDFWPLLKEIDLACFPDIGHSGLQAHLIEMGMPVWGSRSGDILEISREEFLGTLSDLGLDMPTFEVIEGLDKLREHLRDKTEKYIKVSRWRGDFETYHWKDWIQDEGWLDEQALNFGPLKNIIIFLVFDAIETDLEIGGDTYNVDGVWPGLMLNGLEHKDSTYFSAVTKTADMPEQILNVLEAFSPILSQHNYRNQWSMEVRVKDDKAYFIDATCRGGMPSSGSQQLLWKNFPLIVWAGANGEVVDPVPAAQFSIESMLTCKPCKDAWYRVQIPKEIQRNCRLSYAGLVDDCFVFPPDEFHHGELGWLVAIGDTPTETLHNAQDLADQLPDGLDAKLENLTSLLVEIEHANMQGIPFTDQPIPEPAEVIQD